MSKKRNHPVSTGDPAAVITYSRLRPRTVAEPRDFEPIEPHFSATEVPLVDVADPFDESAPDIRPPLDGADDVASVAEVYDKPRRRRPARFAAFVGVVALVLAIGVAVVALGPASSDRDSAPVAASGSADEIMSLEKRIDELASDPAAAGDENQDKISALKARLSELEDGEAGAAAPAKPAPAVREIPLTDAQPEAAAEEAPPAATTAMVPPVPRLRPEAGAASEPGQSESAVAEDSDEFIAEIERTLSGVDAAAAPPAAAPPAAAEAAPAEPPADTGSAGALSEDDFVKGIERALAP